MKSASAFYLDTNVIIALIEGPKADPYGLGSFMESLWKSGKVQVITSELSFAELMVLPYRNGDSDLISQYLGLFVDRKRLIALSVSRPILDIAAVLRARRGRLKLPDAIHLATACASNCRFFLTFDSDFGDSDAMRHPFFSDIDFPYVKIIRPDPISLSELAKALQ